jgi:stage V sporulation protein B
MLHFATVLKAISFTFYVRDYLKAFVAMGLSGGLGFWLLSEILPQTMNTAIRVILISAAIVALYLLLLLIFGLIKKNELIRIPLVGKLLSKFAFR